MQDFLRPNFILFQENPRYSGVIPVFVFKDCRLSTGNCRLFGEISYFARIIMVIYLKIECLFFTTVLSQACYLIFRQFPDI